MPSPFPGMDPYLEDVKLWPVFHHHLVLSIYQSLLPVLVDRYRARISQRHYVTEQALFISVVREEQHEEYLEIYNRNDGKLTTLIEVISLANKTTDEGRKAYLDRRQSARIAGANLVEMDLLIQGQRLIESSVDSLPEFDYAVTVSTAKQPNRIEIYATTIQKRLPRFRMPLAPDDREVVIDLHTVFSRAFDQGGFADKVDYSHNPPVSLSAENLKWVEECLRLQKLR